MIISRFGTLIVVQEKWIIGMSEYDVFSKERVFDKGMINVDLLENVVITMYKSELVVAFAARLIIKVQRVFSH